jgi:hypothetical protein
MLKGVKLIDRIELPTARKITDSGQMIVPCAFARTGGQVYTAAQLGLTDEDPLKTITVMRDEADVFSEESLETFRSVPVTIGHPKDSEGNSRHVTSDNSAELQVGVLEGMPVRDEDTLIGTLVIARQDAIDLIDEGTKELSAGYTCDLELVDVENEAPVYYQRNIRANHIAIVTKGRAGPACVIADEGVEEEPVVVEEPVVAEEVTISDELVQAKSALVTLTDELEASKAEVVSLKEELTLSIEDRCDVIIVARDLTDLVDFSGKSVDEIRSMVVSDQMPKLVLDGKSAAYINARFDVLVEDAEIGETQMGKLLRDNAEVIHTIAKPSTLVNDARERSIARNK